MELTDLLTYLKANKNDLPTDNGFRDQVHKAFMAYVKLMNAPNATVYDVYYNIEAFYEAMKATYASKTLRNYTLALSDALSLSAIKEIFTQEQLTDFSEQMKHVLEDSRTTYNEGRKTTAPPSEAGEQPEHPEQPPHSLETLESLYTDVDASNEIEALDITTLDATDTAIVAPAAATIEPKAATLSHDVLLYKLKTLEEENERLKEKINKQKKKIEDLRQEAKLDSKNATTRVWNVLITAINNQNHGHGSHHKQA